MLVLWALVGTSLLSIFLEITPAGRPEASGAVVGGAVATVAALVLRGLMRLIWRRVTPPEPIAVIGPAVSADAVRRKLELFPDLHMQIVETRETLDRRDGSDGRWPQRIERIVYAPASVDDAAVREVVELSRERGLLLSVVPPFRGLFGSSAEVNHVADLPILAYRRGDFSRSTLFLKRVFDVVVSAFGLVVLLPFFAVIGVAIKLDSRGPVVFSQVRAGLHGRPFTMRKFRSMVDDAEELLQDLVPLAELDEPMFKLRDDPRVTRVGRFLRRWSIDELPQLWNVLLGADESGRPAPRADRARCAVRAGAPVPARREAGPYRADAGLRAWPAHVRGAPRGRAGLHRTPVDRRRRPDRRDDPRVRVPRSRRLLTQSPRLRIQLWSWNYDPEPTAMGPIATLWARHMTERGHDVSVVTAYPHYPRAFWGQRLRPRREIRGGVHVLRLPLWIGHESATARIREEATYATSVTGALTILPSPDVYVVVSPSFAALAPLSAVARVRRRPWVLWLQDILPEAALTTGLVRDSSAVRAAARFERLAYRSADRIVVISETFRGNLLDKGVPDPKIAVIYNPAFAGSPPRSPTHDAPTILAMGNIGLSQALAEHVRAFEASTSTPDS